MNELVIMRNQEAVCDSLQVAEKFGKRHDKVLRAIEDLRPDDSTQNWGECFRKSSYKDSSGKSNKKYYLNRDGFSLLAMGFTGKKALEWKWNYIKAFNAMEALIKEKSSTEWLETRKAGKLTRKSETDTIKQLVEHAQSQGSKNAKMLYVTYSKLANKMAGVSGRDQATIMQLHNLSLMEHIILHEIKTGIIKQLHYKEIYQLCKHRLASVKDLAYLEQAV